MQQFKMKYSQKVVFKFDALSKEIPTKANTLETYKEIYIQLCT